MSASAFVGPPAHVPLLTTAGRRGIRSAAFAWAALPALAAWTVLAAFGRGDEGLTAALCLSPDTGMVEGWSTSIAAALSGLDPVRWAVSAVLMIAAMMLPLAAPMIAHVAGRSFAARRGRSVGLFVLGFGLAWFAGLAGAALLSLIAQSALAGLGAGGLLAPALGLAAAAWQCSASKARAVNRCHGVVTLRGRGAAADRDALSFGLLHASRCLRACLPTMAPLLAAPHGLLPMAAVSAVLLAERARPYPQYRTSAVVLLLVGVHTALA